MTTKKPEKYSSFIELNGHVFPNLKRTVSDKLAPGAYTVEINEMNGEPYLTPISTSTDSLLDLPSPEYKQVVDEIKSFLKPETKELFKEFGYLYKRSALLYGAPGGGKTGIVNRVSQLVIAQGGIVLFDPAPAALKLIFKALEDIQPDVLTMVIYEEFDRWIRHGDEEFLSVLDGEIQKPNVIYVATTNHIDKIPERLRRPGRFSSTIEVLKPNLECREFYLNTKLKNQSEARQWAEATEGFTIDELKETVLAVKCLDIGLDTITGKILKNQSEISNFKEERKSDDRAKKDLSRMLAATMEKAFSGGQVHQPVKIR